MQIIGSMHIGGAENVVLHLVQGLDRARFDVAVCCTKQLGVVAERLKRETADVDITLAAPRRRWMRHLTPLLTGRAIAAFRPDIVHTHGTTAILHTGPLAALRLLPVWIHTFHRGNYDSTSDPQLRLERFFCRHAGQLVAVSDAQRESVIRRHGLSPHRILTVTNGVAPNKFLGDPSVAAGKRAELGFEPDDIIVGTIAVLTEQKGIPYLLQAGRAVVDRSRRVKLLVVGGGPLERTLREQADALGLGSHVRFTGWRQDSAELMTTLDVFVMSSLWEAMPMVLLEAMAARRAIVVTDVGENRRVVGGGRGGEVVPPADADALAHAILGVIGDQARATALRAAAYREYRERFSVDHMLAEHQRLYARVGVRSVWPRVVASEQVGVVTPRPEEMAARQWR